MSDEYADDDEARIIRSPCILRSEMLACLALLYRQMNKQYTWNAAERFEGWGLDVYNNNNNRCFGQRLRTEGRQRALEEWAADDHRVPSGGSDTTTDETARSTGSNRSSDDGADDGEEATAASA